MKNLDHLIDLAAGAMIYGAATFAGRMMHIANAFKRNRRWLTWAEILVEFWIVIGMTIIAVSAATIFKLDRETAAGVCTLAGYGGTRLVDFILSFGERFAERKAGLKGDDE